MKTVLETTDLTLIKQLKISRLLIFLFETHLKVDRIDDANCLCINVLNSALFIITLLIC
jgi:hypothetical protein